MRKSFYLANSGDYFELDIVIWLIVESSPNPSKMMENLSASLCHHKMNGRRVTWFVCKGGFMRLNELYGPSYAYDYRATQSLNVGKSKLKPSSRNGSQNEYTIRDKGVMQLDRAS